jgi:SlyX protein
VNHENIQRLEEKIAYLEHHVTEQDKVMLEFSEDLARLRREIKTLAARVAGSATGVNEGEQPTDERPPHY